MIHTAFEGNVHCPTPLFQTFVALTCYAQPFPLLSILTNVSYVAAFKGKHSGGRHYSWGQQQHLFRVLFRVISASTADGCEARLAAAMVYTEL